jgi:hypothetical protein
VRQATGHRDTLYRAVVEAVVDYHDRFGDSCDPFDDYQRDALVKSCDRVLGRLAPASSAEAAALGSEPPPGFTREILDAMDQTLRFVQAPTAS